MEFTKSEGLQFLQHCIEKISRQSSDEIYRSTSDDETLGTYNTKIDGTITFKRDLGTNLLFLEKDGGKVDFGFEVQQVM